MTTSITTTTKRTFRVAMLGLPESERRILKNISRISNMRTYSYDFADYGGLTAYDMLIGDAESPEALNFWRDSHPSVPVVVLGGDKAPNGKWLKRPIQGMRLLSLLDEIADALIHAESKSEVVSENQATSAIVATAQAALPEAGQRVRRALVVDDSPTVRKHIELGLAPLGLSVHFAETGEEALERFAGNFYDIVFLDVMLPGIDGYAVCKSIKKAKDKRARATPVIMLTGKSSTFDRIKGSIAGCDTYLTKPLQYQVLREVVQAYLGAMGPTGSAVARSGGEPASSRISGLGNPMQQLRRAT